MIKESKINLELRLKDYPYCQKVQLEMTDGCKEYPAMFSIFQVLEEYSENQNFKKKNLPKNSLTPKERREEERLGYVLDFVNTLAYNIDSLTGKVQFICIYDGNFMEKDFSWSDKKAGEMSYKTITNQQKKEAYELVEKSVDAINKKNINESSYDQKERYTYWIKLLTTFLTKMENPFLHNQQGFKIKDKRSR